MPGATEGSSNQRSTTPREHPTEEEKAADLRAIDAAIDRLRNLTAPDPYVLTIPQDVEPRYHHYSRGAAMQWLDHTPFSPHEHESIQYQTFFYHDHSKDMYVLHNSRPEEPALNGAGPKSATETGANTPNVIPKKKISLNAYKKKLGGGIATPDRAASHNESSGAKPGAHNGPKEKVKAETEEMLAAVAESADLAGLADDQEKVTSKKGAKRKREEGPQSAETGPSPQPGHVQEPESTLESAPATKKARNTSPFTSQGSRSEKNHSSQPRKIEPNEDGSEEDRLPPRLSPGMPPLLSPLGRTKSPKATTSPPTQPMPSRLSPTLPENITNTLKARAHFHSMPLASSTVSKDGKLTPGNGFESVAKRKSPTPRNGFRANSSSPAVRSDVEEKYRPATSTPKKFTEDARAIGESLKAKQPKVSSLVVKLGFKKYKKAQKQALERILQEPPKPRKRGAHAVEEESTDDQPAAKLTKLVNGERKAAAGPVRGVAQKVKSTLEDVESDRTRPMNDTLAEDPRRAPPLDEKQANGSAAAVDGKQRSTAAPKVKEPSTPTRPDAQSPQLETSAQKSHLTPAARKDVASVAMRRDISQDSTAAKTPLGQPSSKTPKQQAWEAEQRRLGTLGRDLKRAATAHLNAPNTTAADSSAVPSEGATAPTTEQKLAAAASLESLCCYLLAFTCGDEAALAADPKLAPSAKPWRTLHGFFGFVKKACEPFPRLGGLACALGVAFNARILALATQFPSSTSHDGGGGSTSAGSGDTSVVHTMAVLQRAAAEQDAKLDVDALTDAFPRTWAARARGPANDDALLEPGHLLHGPFKLPFGLVTSPVRAARAGHAMLAEWLEAEGVEYTLKLTG